MRENVNMNMPVNPPDLETTPCGRLEDSSERGLDRTNRTAREQRVRAVVPLATNYLESHDEGAQARPGHGKPREPARTVTKGASSPFSSSAS